MLRKLEAAPVTLSVPLPPVYATARDAAMHTLGIGTNRNMKSVVTGIFLPSWQFREYTLSEKFNLWRGEIFSHINLWNEMISTDLTQKVSELEIPVYFFHGVLLMTPAVYPPSQIYASKSIHTRVLRFC